MKRRALGLGALALGAVAAGAGTAWWRSRGAAPSEPAADPKIDLWSLSFATPDGPALAMESLRGKPLLLNFWATWCAPCVIEMPLLDAFSRAGGKDWNVLALAIDSLAPVRRFVAERKLELPIALAGDVGIDLTRQLGNVAGALPFTVLFDPAGQLAQRHLGAVDAALLASWARSIR